LRSAERWTAAASPKDRPPASLWIETNGLLDGGVGEITALNVQRDALAAPLENRNGVDASS
jgi:hypothetical protein